MSEKKIRPQLLCKRWLRDHRSPGLYVPEDKAPPARGLEGFELREDGSYIDIGFSPTDAICEAEGVWTMDEDNVLKLRPAGKRRAMRKIRVIDATEDRLIIEE